MSQQPDTYTILEIQALSFGDIDRRFVDRSEYDRLKQERDALNKIIAGYERDQKKIIFDQGDQAKTIMQQIERIAELRQQNALYQDEVEQLNTDFNAQEVRMHEVRKERDALRIEADFNFRQYQDLGAVSNTESERLESERDALAMQVVKLKELIPKRLPNGFVSFGKYFAEQEDLFADPYNTMSKFKKKYLSDCEAALETN